MFWLAAAAPDGKRRWYHVDRDQWSVHFNISPDGKLFAGDGGDEEMVAHAKDGKWLYLFTPQTIPDVAGISAPNADDLVHPGTLLSERLVDMKKHDYRLEPNIIFTPRREVAHLPLEHARRRAHLHGRGGQTRQMSSRPCESACLLLFEPVAPVRLVFEQAGQSQRHHRIQDARRRRWQAGEMRGDTRAAAFRIGAHGSDRHAGG